MKNLLIAGGGTGGHIAPAIAIGEEAQNSFNVSYACTPRSVDRQMYSLVKGPVHEMNPPRIDKGNKLLLPITGCRAFFRARTLLRRNGIDAVLGTGGYSSFFAIAAAKTMGIPAAVLDTNAIPGRSNRIASRFCRLAFTGLPGGEAGLKCRVYHTGTPVSSRLRKISVKEARESLGIAVDKPVVLFLGGSQGAEGLNDLALDLPEEVTVLLQCGTRDLERVLRISDGKNNIVIEPFVDNLSLWYSAAELAVARAGGQTVAELSAFRVPAVLVPFPYAAEDHQTANAAVLERAGAAILRQQKDLSSSSLRELLIRLFSQPDELAGMEEAMGAVFPADPARRIVSLLAEMVS
jgi:UDP-N-acetylglucosamine--N-acetylmuramyl-(pentapeptide) pyrophosphoryl-undecaprenol N-acetylglucosamine transferase